MVDVYLHIPAEMKLTPLLPVVFALVSLGAAVPSIESYDAHQFEFDLTDVSNDEAGDPLPQITATRCTCVGQYGRLSLASIAHSAMLLQAVHIVTVTSTTPS